jgi:hypothetical protein
LMMVLVNLSTDICAIQNKYLSIPKVALMAGVGVVLPQDHALSRSVAAAAAAFLRNGLPAGVEGCTRVAPGLVDLSLRCARYGGCAWTLRVGGVGKMIKDCNNTMLYRYRAW